MTYFSCPDRKPVSIDDSSVLRHKSLYYDCHSCPDFHRDKLQQESKKNRAWMPHQVRHDMLTKSKEALDAQH